MITVRRRGDKRKAKRSEKELMSHRLREFFYIQIPASSSSESLFLSPPSASAALVLGYSALDLSYYIHGHARESSYRARVQGVRKPGAQTTGSALHTSTYRSMRLSVVRAVNDAQVQNGIMALKYHCPLFGLSPSFLLIRWSPN
jgi:hypothetical protein